MQYDPASMLVPGPWHRALAQGLELRTWADQRAVDSTYALAQHLANLTAQGVKLGGPRRSARVTLERPRHSRERPSRTLPMISRHRWATA